MMEEALHPKEKKKRRDRRRTRKKVFHSV